MTRRPRESEPFRLRRPALVGYRQEMFRRPGGIQFRSSTKKLPWICCPNLRYTRPMRHLVDIGFSAEKEVIQW